MTNVAIFLDGKYFQNFWHSIENKMVIHYYFQRENVDKLLFTVLISMVSRDQFMKYRTDTDMNEIVPLLIEAEWRIYASVILPSLFQIMACRLAGAKPLSKSMMEYC